MTTFFTQQEDIFFDKYNWNNWLRILGGNEAVKYISVNIRLKENVNP